jgi:hypothetical protein
MVSQPQSNRARARPTLFRPLSKPNQSGRSAPFLALIEAREKTLCQLNHESGGPLFSQLPPESKVMTHEIYRLTRMAVSVDWVGQQLSMGHFTTVSRAMRFYEEAEGKWASEKQQILKFIG